MTKPLSDEERRERRADTPHVLLGADGNPMNMDLNQLIRNAALRLWIMEGGPVKKSQPLATSDPVIFGRGFDCGFAALVVRMSRHGMDVMKLLRDLKLT